jgi:hypothetical protein
MKVKELIEILEECDAEADVFVMSQENYPFEHRLAGVAVRKDFAECDEADGEEEGPTVPPSGDRWTAPERSLPRNDVFILEGSQVRYGSSAAWGAGRR